MDFSSSLSNDRLRYIAIWAFWIIGIILLSIGTYFLYNRLNRQISAVLVFIGGILILYFYYVKWFIVGAKSDRWPPYQTVCPDYLTPIAPDNISTSKSFKCVDLVGVSKNNGLKKANTSILNSQLSDDSYFFQVDPSMSQADLRTALSAKGLSWLSMFPDQTQMA